MAILEAVIIGGFLQIFALMIGYRKLTERIDEFIERIGEIDITPSMEVSERAMEMQLEAAKAERLWGFLSQIMTPNISVQEIPPKGPDGKFT